MNKKKFDNLIHSLAFAIVVLALVAQMPSTTYFFFEIHKLIKPLFPDYLHWGLGGAYALAFEAAVLIWVMKGQTAKSWGFAVASITMNIIMLLKVDSFPNTYYFLGGIGQAIILPLIIAMFSELFAEKFKDLLLEQIDESGIQIMTEEDKRKVRLYNRHKNIVEVAEKSGGGRLSKTLYVGKGKNEYKVMGEIDEESNYIILKKDVNVRKNKS